jgi:hypothetical protein
MIRPIPADRLTILKVAGNCSRLVYISYVPRLESRTGFVFVCGSKHQEIRDMKLKAICAVAGLAGLATPTLAAPVLFATSGANMYRIDLGEESSGGLPANVQHFALETAIVSLTAGHQGQLWGTERYDSNGDGNYAIYSFENVFDTPSMVQQGDFVDHYTSSIVNVNGDLFGYKDDTHEMIQFDIDNGTYDVVGSYAGIGISPASSGWDSESGAFYGVRDSELFRFTFPGEGVSAVKIHDLDFGSLRGPRGGEIIDGVYYHTIVDNDIMHVFSIDLSNGATQELVAFEVLGGGVSTGLAGFPAVPAPGTVALLSLGGFAGLRRRR